MSKICHQHCPSGGGLAVIVVLVVIVAAAAAKPVVHAAELVAEVALIAVACIVGLVVIAAAAWAAIRACRWRASRARAIPAPVRATAAVQGRTAPLAAIEAPKPRLDQVRERLADYEGR